MTASSLALGLLLDRCGARALKLAGTALSCVSLVLLATPFHVDAASSPLHAALVSWALFVGLTASEAAAGADEAEVGDAVAASHEHTRVDDEQLAPFNVESETHGVRVHTCEFNG